MSPSPPATRASAPWPTSCTAREILIHAKRDSKCVPANDVRALALAGSVEENRATHRILVTTARLSPETEAFATRNNPLRIIEVGELKHLHAEHLHTDVRIDVARPAQTRQLSHYADPETRFASLRIGGPSGQYG